MTTTTADTTADTADLLGDAQRAAEHADAASLAVIRPEQQRFDENQRAILRQLGIEEATDGDLDLFFHVCRTTGLDPFRRQIYMIGRNTKVTEWIDDPRAQNGRRSVERWVTKYTIQTGIDGYRRNVREAAKALGDEVRFDGPWFTAEDDFHINDDGEVIQHWRKVWTNAKPPHAARFVTYRNGEPFEGIAHYAEFVQTNRDGSPNSMWAKMPRNQIGKCAEGLSYRRAYPDDLSGLILEDSAQPTVIDSDGNVERAGSHGVAARPAASATITADEILGDEPEPAPAPKKERKRPSGTRSRRRDDEAEPKPEPVYAEVVDEPAAAASDFGPEPEPAQVSDTAAPADDERSPLIRKLFAILAAAEVTERDDRLVIYRRVLKRPEVASTNDLAANDLQYLISGLEVLQERGDLVQWCEGAIAAEAEAQAIADSEGN